MSPSLLGAPARHATASLLRCQTDARLVELVRAGSEPAFEALVSRYEKPLLRYCTRLLPPDRAEDAVQTTFMNALHAIRDSHAEINLRPWLYRIAHNASINLLRDRCWSHTTIDENIDGVERPDQAFARRQGLRDVLTAVTALPQHQRDAMVLRELEGRSYEEIAGQLGVSTGSVRQLLNRGRNTLRAGATAVTPPALLLWPATDASAAVPLAKLAGRLLWSGGAKATAVKAGLAVVAVSAVAGGAGGGGVPTPGGDFGSGPAEASVSGHRAHAGRENNGTEHAQKARAADPQTARARGRDSHENTGQEDDQELAAGSPRRDPGGAGGGDEEGRSDGGDADPGDSEHHGARSDEPEDSHEEAPEELDDDEAGPLEQPDVSDLPHEVDEPPVDPPQVGDADAERDSSGGEVAEGA